MTACEVYPGVFVGDLTAAHFWQGPKMAVREQHTDYLYKSMDDIHIQYVYGDADKLKLEKACDWLDKMQADHKIVLVHCSGGLHRSALVVAYWIATRIYKGVDNMSLDWRVKHAYEQIREYRPEIEPRPKWVKE